MAYVTNGSGNGTISYQYPNGIPSGYALPKNVNYNFSAINAPENGCLYIYKTKDETRNIYHFELYCVEQKTGKHLDGTLTRSIITTYVDDTEEVSTQSNIGFYATGIYSTGMEEKTIADNKLQIVIYSGGSTIPTFDNEESLDKYIKNGDTSGALKDTRTDWLLAIDGTKSPLYKLKWNCSSISKNDIARVKIGYGGYDDISGKISIHKWQLVDYSPSHFNTNYAQINNSVWGEVAEIVSPLASLAAVYIAVQLEYYSTPTVLPTDYSSIMFCELFKNQKNGHMYGDVGFLEKDDNGLYNKVTTGDSSTFTVKDGDAGSKIVTDDDDSGYSDDKDDDENDNDTSDVSSGIGVLTTTFKMTKDRLQQLGRFLWGSNIFDNFSLICNNPIENIISCKSIPLWLNGTTQKIILGNVDTGVNGDKVSNNFAKQNIGSITVTEKYHNFLDYAPYTNVIIYLPYVGFKELDTNLVMSKTLSISYTVDIITGGCLCQITSNNVKLYEFNGNIGIDIPITASNRAQVEAGYISSGIGIASSVASGNIVGAVTSLINSAESQYHYASTSSPNPMCVASTNRTCYIILDRPTYQTLKSFNHTRGKKCYLTKTINTLKGYTICDEHIDLSGIRATDGEKEELIKILSSGFFLF